MVFCGNYIYQPIKLALRVLQHLRSNMLFIDLTDIQR